MNARARLTSFAAAMLLSLPIACKTTPDDHAYLPPPSNGGVSGHMPSGTVTVTITAPADPFTTGPNSDVPVTATVSVQGGSDYIDTSSVSMVLTAPPSSVALAKGVLVSKGADAYAGMLSLSKVPSGTYTLTVFARSSSGAAGSAQTTVTVDGGPVITVLSPAAGHSYNGSLGVELTFDPGAYPVASGPTATLAGMAIPLTPPDATTPTYRATVLFGPTPNPPPGAIQLPALSGEQLFQVQASNSMGIQTSARVLFTVDTDGPTITSTTPISNDVVGGVIKISASVLDDAGVLDASVVAVISDHETPLFELPLHPEGSGIYSTIFDTANLTGCPEPPASGLCLVFPTISFRAVDLVGNQRVVSYGFGVDNVAPIADLDPPLLRQMALTPTGYACSFKFDPLSQNILPGDMPDDLCVVPQVFDLKARIQDTGNRASEVKVVPLSLVDPVNTNVFIMPMDPNRPQPLVVDSNGDGRCDEVNPLLLSTSPTNPPVPPSGILEVRLAPIPPQGKADFRPDLSINSDSPAAPCGPGMDGPPKRLCDSFLIPTIALGYYDSQPAIWSVEPVDGVFHCLGNQVDMLANGVPEGWACIAIQTRDNVGNQSVSVPIRVYIQYNASSGWCQRPPANAPPPPTCTGTFDVNARTATTGACSARKFQRTQLEYYCAAGGC